MLGMLVHDVWDFQRHRVGTFGVGEHVQSSDVEAVDKRARILKNLRSFAAHTRNKIHSDESVRDKVFNCSHLVGKQLTVVVAHQFQHLVASRLQRDVEMRHEML